MSETSKSFTAPYIDGVKTVYATAIIFTPYFSDTLKFTTNILKILPGKLPLSISEAEVLAELQAREDFKDSIDKDWKSTKVTSHVVIY